MSLGNEILMLQELLSKNTVFKYNGYINLLTFIHTNTCNSANWNSCNVNLMTDHVQKIEF